MKQQQAAVTVTSLSISSGPFDTNVLITGTGFDATKANDKVFFNGKAATITYATNTQLMVTVPVGAGTGNVTVSVNNSAPVAGPVFNYQYTYVSSILVGSNLAGEVNGTGAAVLLNMPLSIAIDTGENIFIAGNSPIIRKISPSGEVTSYAGLANVMANNGTISKQQLNLPDAVAVDKNENLYVADAQYGVIWKISPQGSATILKDNTGATIYFSVPQGLTTDNAGNLYVADTFNNQIKKITPQGVVTVLAGNGQPGYSNGQGSAAYFYSPTGVVVDATGNVYVADFNNAHIRKVTPDGTVSDFTPPAFLNPFSITIDSAGNLFVSDSGTGLISKITPGGVVTPFAGKGNLNGIATGLEFEDLHAVAIDKHDNIYVAMGNEIIKIAYQ